MPEFITAHQDFTRRQIEFMAERDAEISTFCVCSLSPEPSACMRRRRPRAIRRHGSRRTTQGGKSNDPDSSPPRTTITALKAVIITMTTNDPARPKTLRRSSVSANGGLRHE
jgi:hypothetical protein